MRRFAGFLALVLAAVIAGGSTITSGGRATPVRSDGCLVRTASETYAAAVSRALRAGNDLWGEQLLADPGGPSYEAARSFLAPMLYGQQTKHAPLTSSGVYYLALSYPTGVYGPTTFALHVADGSEIITRRLGGASLSVYVGRAGRERYGSCIARLTPATLVDGYLPILQTSYVDGNGVRYRQESFAGRIAGARSIVSLVRLTVDARASRAGALVRLRPSTRDLVPARDQLASSTGTRLIVSTGGRFARGAFEFRVAAGKSAVVYADWLHAPSRAPPVRADRKTYDAARGDVARFWRRRLSQGVRISVPEARVNNAQRAVLIQQITHVWRYSVGNQYEEFSIAEGLDTAEVMARYGFDDVAKAILQLSLDRVPRRFTTWRAGERLVAGALYYQLFRDRAFVEEELPVLARMVEMLEARQITSGPSAGRFPPERLCSDEPDPVDGFTSQLVAWQGLLAMGRVWAVTGHAQLAARARTVGVRLEAALRKAVRESLVRLPDGSLFVPDDFSARRGPFNQLTASREGSYWNLVVPYGLASGFFRPGSAETEGLIRYLVLHGSRLLGVTRADAHVLYVDPAYNSGLAQVYGLNVSRFLADNGHSDQLVLSLYGMLAAGMTPETYVSGESVSVTPIGDTYYRKTFFPPNLGANSTFLETLRLLLIEEPRDSKGAPRGLDLAFATPRAWLADGKSIRVDRAPTSFGRLSFSLERRGPLVRIRVTPPTSPQAPTLRVRLRLPSGDRLVNVRLGGRRLPFDQRTATIDVSGRAGPIEILATVADSLT